MKISYLLIISALFLASFCPQDLVASKRKLEEGGQSYLEQTSNKKLCVGKLGADLTNDRIIVEKKPADVTKKICNFIKPKGLIDDECPILCYDVYPTICRVSDDRLLAKLSITSRVMAALTEEEFQFRSVIRSPLALPFYTKPNELKILLPYEPGVCQPYKHSYFLRLALSDLIDPFGSKTFQNYGFDTGARIKQSAVYCEMHEYILSDLMYNFLYHGVFQEKSLGHLKKFNSNLADRLFPPDPIALEIEFALKCSKTINAGMEILDNGRTFMLGEFVEQLIIKNCVDVVHHYIKLLDRNEIILIAGNLQMYSSYSLLSKDRSRPALENNTRLEVAEKCCLMLADQGDIEAQYKLGKIYHKGKKAFKYYKLAADNDKLLRTGDFLMEDPAVSKAYAQMNLGRMYYEGDGVDQNYEMALKYSELAAHSYGILSNGYFSRESIVRVHAILGDMYFYGKGREQSFKLALKHYTAAANVAQEYCTAALNGAHIESQIKLGNMYYNGEGVDKNIDKALEYYTLAADGGHTDTQIKLGNMYYNGEGVDKNIDKALNYYSRLAYGGDVKFQITVGKMYYEGKEVKQSYKNAYRLLEMAKERGDEEAKTMLATMHANDNYVERTYEEILAYYEYLADVEKLDSEKSSAEEEHLDAQNILNIMQPNDTAMNHDDKRKVLMKLFGRTDFSIYEKAEYSDVMILPDNYIPEKKRL